MTPTVEDVTERIATLGPIPAIKELTTALKMEAEAAGGSVPGIRPGKRKKHGQAVLYLAGLIQQQALKLSLSDQSAPTVVDAKPKQKAKPKKTYTCVECREKSDWHSRPCDGCNRCQNCLANGGLTREGPDGHCEFCPICDQCFECCSNDGCDGAEAYPLADD